MLTTKYNSHSPTLKSILVITQTKTKAYQVTKFNQIILICKNSMSYGLLPFYSTQKDSDVHMVKHFNRIIKCDIKKSFDLLSPYRGRGCVKGQNICMHGVLCFILINLIYNMTTFRKESKLTFDPTQGFKGKCKSKIFANMLLYASFPLI